MMILVIMVMQAVVTMKGDNVLMVEVMIPAWLAV